MSSQAPAVTAVALHDLVAQRLARRRQDLHRQGIELRQHLRPVEVLADPQAVTELIDAALAWASSPGARLMVRLELQNWPERALLSLRATPAVHLAGERPVRPPDGPCWDRLSRAARTVDVQMRRAPADEPVVLTLEFARTVKHVSPLTALDVDRLISHDTWQMTLGGKSITGARVLLVTTDASLASAVQAVCTGLALALERVADSTQAARSCELSPPQVIILDAGCNDAAFQQLYSDLVREEMLFPVIEIGREETIPTIAGWHGESIHRIGRDAVRSMLPAALALALAR